MDLQHDVRDAGEFRPFHIAPIQCVRGLQLALRWIFGFVLISSPHYEYRVAEKQNRKSRRRALDFLSIESENKATVTVYIRVTHKVYTGGVQ